MMYVLHVLCHALIRQTTQLLELIERVSCVRLLTLLLLLLLLSAEGGANGVLFSVSLSQSCSAACSQPSFRRLQRCVVQHCAV